MSYLHITKLALEYFKGNHTTFSDIQRINTKEMSVSNNPLDVDSEAVCIKIGRMHKSGN